jgi:Putative zinc-finger/HEAT repeats
MIADLHKGDNCSPVKDLFALYLYGELSFDEEERVETHLDSCAGCRKALERQREVQTALDNLMIEPSPSLLRSSREELHMRLVEAGEAHHGWWDRFTDALTGRNSTSGWLRPAGALTLLAVGFGVARMVPPGAFGSGISEAGVMPSSRVRYVEPASNGKVHIVLDETTQKDVSGALDRQDIRVLLVSATKDPSDPGLRAGSLEILSASPQFAEVRDAFIVALKDKNAGVRLKAMAGLKTFAQQPEVRTALTQVLLGDANPEMRAQAIDLLTKSLNDPADNPVNNYDRQVIGAMQELMQRESNAYVRQRCRTALEAVKASTETY